MFFIDVLPPSEMLFDSATWHHSTGGGVVPVSPKNHIFPYFFVLVKLHSNNVVEYQVLILGLQLAIEMGIKDLNVYGDSQLVIN